MDTSFGTLFGQLDCLSHHLRHTDSTFDTCIKPAQYNTGLFPVYLVFMTVKSIVLTAKADPMLDLLHPFVCVLQFQQVPGEMYSFFVLFL